MVRFDHRQDVRAAQIHLLYQQLPSAVIATTINAAILVTVLWNEVSRTLLLAWLSVVLLLALGRHSLRLTYMRTRQVHEKVPGVYARLYLYGVLANGVLWGFVGFFFFTPRSFI